MEATITKSENLLTIAPAGRLDTVNSADLRDKLAAYETEDTDFELDFTAVDYISSAGLRLLVALQKKAKESGHSMIIRNINPIVREVFRISGFNKAFTVL